MRQVPQYLIIGNGRLARHFQHYFSLLTIPYVTWDRSQPIEILHELASNASHVLVLIKDDAIESFIKTYLFNCSAMIIHCSGSLVTSYAYGAHLLYCFNDQLYDLQQYLTIPFIVDDDAPEFSILFPGLSNTYVRLKKAMKAKYHALCVLSGNFSCLLWQKLFTDFEEELQIPPTFAHPYLQQQMQNLLHDHSRALTGPLTRNDQQTLQKNIQALAHDPFQAIYESFVTCYEQLSMEKSK